MSLRVRIREQNHWQSILIDLTTFEGCGKLDIHVASPGSMLVLFSTHLPGALYINYSYFRSAIMAFKCLTSRVPEYLTSQFSKRGEISGRATRSSQMLNIPLFKTASGQRTFYYRTVSIWNSMDSSLKTLEKVSDFKYFLKRKLIKDFIDC